MAFAEQLSNMNLAELRELQADVEKQIVVTQRNQLKEARDRIYQVAHDLGLSLKELMDRTGLTQEVNSGRAPKPESTRKNKPVAPKYAHPKDSTRTWTGQGKRPNWIKELIEGGMTLDQLRISGV